MSDIVLIVWFVGDVLVSLAIFAGCGYIVFWRGHSGWWFVPAFLLASFFGGSGLYKRLSERVAHTPHQMEAEKK